MIVEKWQRPVEAASGSGPEPPSRRRGPFSLRTSLVLLVLSVVVLSSIAVGAIGALMGSHAAREAFEGKALSLSLQLADNLRLGVMTGSAVYLQDAIERSGRDPDVAGIRVFDAEGAMLASSVMAESPISPVKAPAEVREAMEGRKPISKKTREEVVLCLPVLSRPLGLDTEDPARLMLRTGDADGAPGVHGAVLVRFSTHRLSRTQQEIHLAALITAAVLALLLGPSAVWLGNRITRPLRDLARRVSGDPEIPSALSPEPGDYPEIAALKEALVAASREREKRKVLEEHLHHVQKLEAMGQMAGGFAHDFRNQLQIVLGNLKILEDDLPAGGEAEPLVEDIVVAVRRLSDLTRSFLAFARRDPMKLGPLDLGPLVRETVRMLSAGRANSDRIETEIPAELWTVHGDATHVQQVLTNLCLNALDATASGGRVRVACENRRTGEEEATLRPEVRPGRFVRLTVADEGHGMDAATLSRAFDPFFTTKDPDKGTGLGLSSAFGIVSSHGGWIEATSEPGGGAVFSVFLPAEEDEACPPEGAPQG